MKGCLWKRRQWELPGGPQHSRCTWRSWGSLGVPPSPQRQCRETWTPPDNEETYLHTDVTNSEAEKDGRWEDPYPRGFSCKILNRSASLFPCSMGWEPARLHFTTSGLYRCQFCAVASYPDISKVKQLWHSIVNTKKPPASLLPTDPSCLQIPFTARFPSKILHTIKYNFILR